MEISWSVEVAHSKLEEKLILWKDSSSYLEISPVMLLWDW